MKTIKPFSCVNAYLNLNVRTDSVGNKFEYMRHPARWDKVEANIDKFIHAKENSVAEWWLSICISVSVFNVYNFLETFEYYAGKGLGIYINMVHDHHGIKIIPPEIKQEIIQHLMSYESKFNNIQWQKEREMICNHLKSSTYDPILWKNFLHETKIRDAFRKESFKETFVEYNQLIERLSQI